MWMWRGWAMLLALGFLAQPAAAAEPDHVTYALGGVMSGPFRLEADLVTGAFSEARPPAGQRGDGAGLNAHTIPVTKRWTVPPQKLAVLRRLAEKVWRHGMDSWFTTVVHRRANKAPKIEVINTCQPSLDALGALTLERSGRKRSFDFSMPCLSKDGDAFLHALLTAK